MRHHSNVRPSYRATGNLEAFTDISPIATSRPRHSSTCRLCSMADSEDTRRPVHCPFACFVHPAHAGLAAPAGASAERHQEIAGLLPVVHHSLGIASGLSHSASTGRPAMPILDHARCHVRRKVKRREPRCVEAPSGASVGRRFTNAACSISQTRRATTPRSRDLLCSRDRLHGRVVARRHGGRREPSDGARIGRERQARLRRSAARAAASERLHTLVLEHRAGRKRRDTLGPPATELARVATCASAPVDLIPHAPHRDVRRREHGAAAAR